MFVQNLILKVTKSYKKPLKFVMQWCMKIDLNKNNSIFFLKKMTVMVWTKKFNCIDDRLFH